MGKIAAVERAGAVEEKGTSKVLRTNHQQASNAARATKVLRSVGLVGVSMVVKGYKGVRENKFNRRVTKES